MSRNRRWIWLVIAEVLLLSGVYASVAAQIKKVPGKIAVPMHTARTLKSLPKPNYRPLAPPKPNSSNPLAKFRAGDRKAGLPRKNEMPLSSLEQLIRPNPAKDILNSDFTRMGGDALLTETANRNFGGMLVAPSYQAVPSPYYSMDGVGVTLTADFNNDGSPDLATLNITLHYESKISVLLNDGNGHFASPIVTDASGLVQAPVLFSAAYAVDIDADGFPDIVAASKMADKHAIYVFHNDHGATFSLAATLTPIFSEGQIGSFVVGDANEDGVLDIVAISAVYDEATSDSTITVQAFLGEAGGVFSTTSIESGFLFPSYIATLPNKGALLQNLNGKLNLVLEVGAYVFDGPNLVMAGTSIMALPANGDGTFEITPSVQIDVAPARSDALDLAGGLGLTDLNGDGVADIFLNLADGYVYTALGKPDGTFSNLVVATNGFGIYPIGWALVDLNRDGYPDFVDYDLWHTSIWLGKGDGTFANTQHAYSTQLGSVVMLEMPGLFPGFPGSNLVVADFNADTIADLAIVDGENQLSYNRASIFLGNGDGALQAAPALVPLDDPNIAPGDIFAVTSLDLNGDGNKDVLMQSPTLEGMPFIAALGDGRGNFTFKNIGTLGGLTPKPIYAVADFNNDGLEDYLFLYLASSSMLGSTNNFAVALSNGDGTLKDAIPTDPGPIGFLKNLVRGISVGDINKDGNMDFVAAYGGTRDTPGILIALGNGDGTFQPYQLIPFGSENLQDIKLADLDGDGNLDVVLSDVGSNENQADANVAIFFGNADGTFSPSMQLFGWAVTKVLAGDLNGDAKPDLVLLSFASTTTGLGDPAGEGALVFLNVGERQFVSAGMYTPGVYLATGELADFNTDGILDLALSLGSADDQRPDFYGIKILLGNGDGTFGSDYNAQVPYGFFPFLVGDFLKDGAPDLAGETKWGATILLLNQGGSSISLKASSTSLTEGQTGYITATVEPTMSFRPVPTGTITFTENGTEVGTGTLSAGSATIAIPTLPVGSHTLVARYSGDGAFNPNNNAGTVALTVTAKPEVPPAFSLQASGTELTLSSGSTGVLNMIAAANSTYTGTVTFAVSGPLKNLNVQITPAQVTLSGNQTATVAVTVSTVAPRTAALKHAGIGWPGSFGGASLVCMLGMVLPRKRRHPRLSLTILCAFVVLAAVAGFTGCGDGNPYKVADKGSTTFVVTATPSVNGVSAQAVNITVTVQ